MINLIIDEYLNNYIYIYANIRWQKHRDKVLARSRFFAMRYCEAY